MKALLASLVLVAAIPAFADDCAVRCEASSTAGVAVTITGTGATAKQAARQARESCLFLGGRHCKVTGCVETNEVDVWGQCLERPN